MERVEIKYAYKFPKEIKKLFGEYTELLIKNDETFKKYLEIQNYDKEIENLEEKYGLPFGRLYILFYDEEVAGCVGLKRIDENSCELKRLYVRDKFRGKKLGEKLVEKIIRDAKKIGYKNILLDTLPFLDKAIMLYKKYNFYEIESYNDSPMQNSIFMKLDL